jgi:hypothetical protein
MPVPSFVPLPHFLCPAVAARLHNRRWEVFQKMATEECFLKQDIVASLLIIARYLKLNMRLNKETVISDRLCGLVVRVPGYRSRRPEFLRRSGSGTGSTEPRQYNRGAAWIKKDGSSLESRDYCHRDLPR